MRLFNEFKQTFTQSRINKNYFLFEGTGPLGGKTYHISNPVSEETSVLSTFISSAIGKAFLGPTAAPEAYLIYDTENHDVTVATEEVQGAPPSNPWLKLFELDNKPFAERYSELSASDAELAALRQAASDYDTKLSEATAAILVAQQEVLTLLGKNDTVASNQILTSLKAIYKNLNGKELPSDQAQDPLTVVRETFSAILDSTEKNAKHITAVANAVEVQLAIEKHLVEGTALPRTFMRMIAENNFPKEGNQIVWPAIKNQAPFSGSVEEYIQQRQHALTPTVPQDLQPRAKTLLDKVAKATEATKIKIEGTEYQFVAALSGRGQAGAAGFFSPPQSSLEYLIKEDDPGTCLAEGLAVIPRIPDKEHPVPPIIQASTYLATLDESRFASVSMQASFTANPGEQMAGFDVLIMGRKRKPKTLVSEEHEFRAGINTTISNMSPDVKKQLAMAIFTSQVNGDESLHTGQFMVSHKDGVISKIQRIDLGALGRYAVGRKDFDPLATSELYQNSGQFHLGQFKKDYVGYLLQNKDLRKELLELWDNANVQEIVTQVEEKFEEQVRKLDGNEGIKREALLGFYKTLTKDSPEGSGKKLKELEKLSTDQLEQTVKNHLISTTATRCEKMQANATIHLMKDALMTLPSDHLKVNHLKMACLGILNGRSSPKSKLDLVKRTLDEFETSLAKNAGLIKEPSFYPSYLKLKQELSPMLISMAAKPRAPQTPSVQIESGLKQKFNAFREKFYTGKKDFKQAETNEQEKADDKTQKKSGFSLNQ